LDSKHLVGIGHEGFYGPDSGKTDFNPGGDKSDWAAKEGQVKNNIHHSGNIQGTFREHENIQGTFREHSRNMRIFREHSGNIRGTFFR
jgi:hypothetical protein